MEQDPIANIGLGTLLILSLITAFWIAARNAKVVRNTKIELKDGKLRPATRKEQFLIAQHLARDKGKHFWHLIVAGIIIIAAVILVMKLVLVPRLDL